MKKMICSIAAAMLLLGTMNSQAQGMNRPDHRFDDPRPEMRQAPSNDPDHRRVVADRRAEDERTYVMDHRMPVPEALPPRDPRPRHEDHTGTTVVAAAVGAAVGAIVSSMTR